MRVAAALGGVVLGLIIALLLDFTILFTLFTVNTPDSGAEAALWVAWAAPVLLPIIGGVVADGIFVEKRRSTAVR